jgi:thiamine-phosphate pyrophosphorylase
MLLPTETPLVYLITTGTATNDNFSETGDRILEIIRASVKAGIPLLQIREKSINTGLLFDLASQAAKITNGTNTQLLINDRSDVALASGADGVHLTSNSISAKTVRENFPENFILGVSCHSLQDVLRAKKEGADFATFSPVFATPNKGELQGVEKLREVCNAAVNFPVIALGGIDETNFESALQVGASGVAAIRLLNDVERLSRFAEKARRFQRSQ